MSQAKNRSKAQFHPPLPKPVGKLDRWGQLRYCRGPFKRLSVNESNSLQSAINQVWLCGCGRSRIPTESGMTCCRIKPYAFLLNELVAILNGFPIYLLQGSEAKSIRDRRCLNLATALVRCRYKSLGLEARAGLLSAKRYLQPAKTRSTRA
ncbi:hypothetical protein [Tuwongella immobilis]|uniref:Uncharacterized protein n=1 Tax=Tuwongella immobilis TaxID=692036 RepID=A0A6C2YP70_9BACT|nr:hypothetical protein [Tuwongella immobilis]VIP03091.1 unnamed protein product [Tuwongella immobilis]VTS03360.1 unnamed protein product [Tuwongella immobilis]